MVNREGRPFDNAEDPPRHGARDRPQGVHRHPEPRASQHRRRDAAAARGELGHAARDARRSCPATAPTSRRTAPRRARSWRAWATARARRSRSRCRRATSPIYRDPAVILIDQLKKIYIEGELEVIDTSIWHAKVTRKDYTVGMNLTGVGVDDPDVQPLRELCLRLGAQLHAILQRRGRQAVRPAVAGARPRASASSSCGRSSGAWRRTCARPIIYHDRAATCWQPHVKGFVLHDNSIYNHWRFENVWLDH